MSSSFYEQTGLPFGSLPGPPIPSQLVQEMRDEDDLVRLRESEQIAEKVQKEFEKRSPNKTMSPEWLAAQPKSLKEKLRVTPEEEEDVLFHFASTSSIPQTITLSGVGQAKVRAIVYNPDSQERLATLRNAMRMSIVRKLEETQMILLDAIQDPDKLKDASVTQISSVLKDVSETHHNLLAAARSPENFLREMDPASIYTGEELELMAFLSRRLAVQQTGSPRTALPSGSPLDSPEALDADFVVASGEEVDVGVETEFPGEGLSAALNEVYDLMKPGPEEGDNADSLPV